MGVAGHGHGGGSATPKGQNPYHFYFFLQWGGQTTSRLVKRVAPLLSIFFFKFLIFFFTKTHVNPQGLRSGGLLVFEWKT
jgi:hypothetical protein